MNKDGKVCMVFLHRNLKRDMNLVKEYLTKGWFLTALNEDKAVFTHSTYFTDNRN